MPQQDIPEWDLTTRFKQAVEEKGGYVSTHAHFDKAFYITQMLAIKGSTMVMEEKWRYSDEQKRSDTQEDVENRIRIGVDKLIAQGCTMASTFVDGYDAVGTKAADAANTIKEEYKDRFTLITMPQPLGGLLTKESRELFEEVAAKCDLVGGLPSYDRPNLEENLDAMFEIAKNLNKPVHCHIDQENNPQERDTEILVNKTIEHGYEGRVVAVHAISTSAQPNDYRKELYKKMADVGMAVAVSPSAALGMKQLNQLTSPVHNSIANVPEMLEAGITVGVGVDNVHDFYHPFVDADLWVEMRILMEACRFYDFEALVDIASTNGRKILSMK